MSKWKGEIDEKKRKERLFSGDILNYLYHVMQMGLKKDCNQRENVYL